MDKKPCFYSVVEYIPDLVRNEQRNIGIIVQSKDFNYINCKFLTNLHTKLGGTATRLDIKIIKAYIEDFAEIYKAFTKFPPVTTLFTDQAKIFTDNYLGSLAKQGLGKIQFTEPRGCLTNDPEKELGYLFNTFVGEETQKVEELVKHTRLKTEIKKEFKKNKLLAGQQEESVKKGFEIDVRVPGQRSKVEHLIDFVLENGKSYMVETVDMKKKDRKMRELETFETAVKFDDLSYELDPDKLVTYSLVDLPEDDTADGYLKILESYSTKVILYNKEEKKRFLSEMNDLVFHKPDLFKNY